MSVDVGGQQLFDIARQTALNLREVLSVGDEIFSIYASSGIQAAYENERYSFESVSRILQKSKVSQKKTDLVSAWEEAKELLKNCNNINKEIYLISDLQKSGIKEVDKSLLPIIDNDEIKVFVIPINKKRLTNLAIAKINLVNQIIEKGKVFEIEAVIKNVGDNQVRNKLVQVFLNDKRAGQTTVELKPGESKAVKFKLIPLKAGVSTGSILVEDDDLYFDNRRYFTFFVPEKIKVLLIGQNENDVKFFRIALNPTSKLDSRFNTDFIAATQIEFSTLKKYQVVLLSNVQRIEGTLLSSIYSYVEEGGGLLIFLGDNVDLRNYNENFNKKLSLPLFTETIGEFGSKEYNLRLGKVDFSHPIFYGVFDKENQNIDSPLFYFLTKVKSQPEDDIIIEFSNGDPFLIDSNKNKGGVMLFTSTIDPNWSDRYLKGIFVPLMNRCVAYLANNAIISNQDHFVSEVLTTKISGVENYENLTIETPGGNRIRLSPRIEKGDFVINFLDTEEAGIYSLSSDNKILKKFSVNVDVKESELKTLNSEEIEKTFGRCKIISNNDTASLVNEIRATRYGHELWKYCIGLVLILLFFEMMLARETGTKINEIKVERIGRAS